MKMKRISGVIKGLLAVCTMAAASAFPTDAKASCGPGDSVYIGSVCITATEFCPHGYEPMSGQLITIASNSALFSLLGCKWGGDCRTTFAIPDMRGRMAMGAGQGPGLTDRTLGQQGGTETHALTKSELATHDHTATFTPAGSPSIEFNAYDGLGKSVTPDATNNYLQTVGANAFAPSTDTLIYGDGTGTEVPLGGVDFVGTSGVVTVGPTGDGRPFSIINPMTVLKFCMASEGIYPPRN